MGLNYTYLLNTIKVQRQAANRKTVASLGATDLLVLILITLKLTGHINWSWWWILAAWWIPLSLVFAYFTLKLAGDIAKASKNAKQKNK